MAVFSPASVGAENDVRAAYKETVMWSAVLVGAVAVMSSGSSSAYAQQREGEGERGQQGNEGRDWGERADGRDEVNRSFVAKLD